MKKHYLAFIIFSGIIIFSCQKEEFVISSDATLKFSQDTVSFDTIFTTRGSTTKRLKVYNVYNDWIRISEIKLAKEDNSFFRLNVDGIATNHARNIEIPPKDSILLLIEVTIDPNNDNSPLVVQDSILFIVNGNTQDVDLIAWGQDVHLFRGDAIPTQTWTPDKPYLIIDSVVIDSNSTLTIEAGTVIHFHKQAVMLVWGDLLVEGERDNPVIFRGDRLDEALTGLSYDKLPEQWGGIVFFYTSADNNIRYAIIKNGIYGLLVQGGAKVNIENTIIDNHSFAGIYALFATISAKNCLITNCGDYNLALVAGGNYEFYHSTIANYYSFSSRTQRLCVALTNFVEIGNETYVGDLENAYFGNCIIYSNNTNGIGLGELPDATFNYTFENCLMKLSDTTDMNLENEAFINVIYNKDPKFKTIDYYEYEYNFELDTLSPAKDKGSIEITNAYPILETDILGNSRDDNPDIGVYERIE